MKRTISKDSPLIYYFTKGPESSLCSHAALKLGTPIAGAEFFTKLVATDKAPKKRMKAPELFHESEAVAKKKAKSVGGKAKCKPKAKAKANGSSNPFAESVAGGGHCDRRDSR